MKASVSVQQIPSRFKPDAKKGREARALRFLLGKDGLPSAAQMDQYRALLMQGDPLDEAVANWAAEVGFARSRALLDQALEQGIEAVTEAPEFLKDLFAHIDSEPLWLDRSLLLCGQRAVCRTGDLGVLVMRDVALMGGYGNAAINKPLMFTGSLADSAARRTSETRAFAIDATRPGAMDRDGKGFKTTVRVRFLHALLRQRIRRHPDWRDEEWGLPINQGDMLATNLAFSVLYITGMRALGIRYSSRERAGILHLWRYIGYLMGIDERVLVTSEREGLRILYTVLISQPEADEDTRQLALALMNEPYESAGSSQAEQLWAEMKVRMHNGVSHFFLGNRSYRNLGLPEDRRWSWVPLAVIPAVTALETVRQLMPFGNQVFTRLGTAWRDHSIKRALAGQAAAYKPVDFLTRQRHG